MKLLQNSFCLSKNKTELKYFDLKYILADRLFIRIAKTKLENTELDKNEEHITCSDGMVMMFVPPLLNVETVQT